MRRTLLALVQRTLSAVDSEDVNTVDETPEAAMVVNIANRAFENMAVSSRWRHFRQLTTLTTNAYKNQLVLPTNAYDIQHRLYYAGQPVYYRDPQDFLQMSLGRSTSDTTTYDNIRAYTDRNPSWYTSFNDLALVFDSVPSAISGLNGTDCHAIIYVFPDNELISDGEYFDLPPIAFPALQDLMISYAHGELKGDSDAAVLMLREYRSKLANLKKNARLIDPEDDVRAFTVPRRTTRTLGSYPIPTGNGYV